METLHPGLYRYATPAQMTAQFDRLAATFCAGPTLGAAFLALARTLSAIRCGHTYPNFHNQAKSTQAALFSGRDKLPFWFGWIGERMIVTDPKDAAGALRAGDEILRINDRSVAAIQRDLLPLVRADGDNTAKRRSLLSVRGDDAWETFDIFYALAIHNGEPDFDLLVRSIRGPGRRVTLSAIDLEQRRAQAPTVDKDGPLWNVREEQGAHVLTMPGWAVYNSKWDWRGFLDRLFEDLAARAAPALIVDLRANEGGLDCGDEIIARLIDAPLQRAAFERRVRYRRAPQDLLPHLSTWDDSFKDWGDAAEPIDDRFYRLIEREGQSRAPIAPKGPRYKGKVIVLVGAVNSSATFQFANLIQSNRLGVLVGEPTGGNQRGINGGGFFFMTLPNSKLEVDVPLIGTFPQRPAPDAGLTPDVLIADVPRDIAVGRDAVMQRALALARG
jgi:hypothetical protein